MRLESSFDEVDLLEKNKAFLFENMPSIKEILVHVSTSDEAKGIEGSEVPRESAEPGKPSIYFF